MELKFIWINQYRVIENLGVNFNHSDEHRFSFDSNTLYLLPNPKLPVGFGPKVTGVTAIAGENGSGKSSLCEAVLLSTATRKNGLFGYNQPFKGIVCYGDHIFIQRSISVKNKKQLAKAGYTIISFEGSPFEKMKDARHNSFVKGGFIYYSNVFDFRAGISEANLANISTMSALEYAYGYSTSKREQSPVAAPRLAADNPDEHGMLKTHYNVEGNRVVKFYLSHRQLISFIPVRHFLIKCTYSGNNRWLDHAFLRDAQKIDIDSFWKIRGIEEIEKRIFDRLAEKRSDKAKGPKLLIGSEIKVTIKALYRYNLCISFAIASKELPDAEELENFVFHNGPVPASNSKTKIQKLCRLHERLVNEAITSDDEEFSPSSVANYYHGAHDWRFYLIENYFLTNTPENCALLHEFLTLEEKTLSALDAPFRRITNYNVSQLSAGENSLLTLFARLADVMERHASSQHDEKEKLILFIDEGEIGFHPAWKRKYFDLLLDFLNKCKYGYKFQLIITTHSPYLLSDLPTVNTILLRKGEDGRTNLVDTEAYQTFGANINDLLSTSFFLEEGLIGAFATRKIQALINNLQITGSVAPDELMSKEQMRDMIELIAEPFLREKLLDMYFEKYPEDKQMKIKQLQAQIKRLENG